MAHLTLGIETSCDETSAAVVEDGRLIRSNVIASQVPLHQKYGGVVPEIASRKHLEAALPVVREALEQAGATLDEIDLVAVTQGPGLVGALLVGLSLAKGIALGRGLPLVGVHHLRGHIYANFLEAAKDAALAHAASPGAGNPEFPFVCLIVSGGHTDIAYLRDHGHLELLGSTRDDAAGEAFDKVARVLGLPYPGGPHIDRLAQQGRPEAVPLPRARLEEGSLDFSFSGLKTAVLQWVRSQTAGGRELDDQARADLAASFQQAVADVLVEKTLAAAEQTGCRQLVLAGGVAANSALRRRMGALAGARGLRLHYPPLALCTDNAAMIAAAAYYAWRQGRTSPLDINAVADLPL